MRRSTRVLTTSLVLLGLTTVGLPAYAADASESTAQLVAEVAPDQGAVQTLVADGESASTTAGGVTVEVPLDAGQSVEAAGVALPLPAEVDVKTGDVTGDGTVVYDGRRGSADLAVQVLADGSTRVQTVSSSPKELQDFTYSFGEGAQIQEADGAVYVLTTDANGEMGVVEMAAPWAVDANGVSVPTRYEVQGTDVVQVVEATADTAFPVVADPKYKWWHAAYSMKFNRAETRDIKNAAPWSGACGRLAGRWSRFATPCIIAGAYLFAQANIAYGRGECVLLTLAPPGLVYRYKDSDCR